MHYTARPLFALTLACAFAASCADDDPSRDPSVVANNAGANNGGSSGSNNTSSANTCTAPKLDCGGTCVDTTNDPRHCGGCGTACEPGDLCQAGACVTPQGSCTEGTLSCEGFTYCVEQTGRCLAGCATTEQCDTNEVCDTSSHACACAEGFGACADGSPGCCPLGPGTFSQPVTGNYTDVELLVGPDGRAYVVGVEAKVDSASLFYAAEDDDGEFLTTVDLWEDEVDGEIAAVIDDASTIHVAYAGPAENAASGANNSILYMTLERGDSGLARTVEEVHLTSEAGPLKPDIALDPTTGEPAIAFVESGSSAGRSLKLARRSGAGSWAVESVDTISDFEEPSLSFTSAGDAEISYREMRSLDVKLAIHAFDDWYTETLRTEGDLGACGDHALSPSDLSGLTYLDATNATIEFTWLGDTDWESSSLGPAADCRETSVVFDASGTPHVTWVDAGAGKLYYAWREEGSWERLDLGEAAGLSDVALSPEGKVRIATLGADPSSFRVWTQR